MQPTKPIFCPVCNNKHLVLKYQATYEYSYIIDDDAPGLNNTQELLPYLYDDRQQKEATQYIECSVCGSKYPCYFAKWTGGIQRETIQKALHEPYNSAQRAHE